MRDRRQSMTRRHALAAIGVAALGVRSASSAAAKAMLSDDGLYQMDWYLESFLDLSDDLAGATAKGKRFAIMWGLKGCPACKRMHMVHMVDPENRKLRPRQFRDPASQSHRRARGDRFRWPQARREGARRSLRHSFHADDPVLSGIDGGSCRKRRTGARSRSHAGTAGAAGVSRDVSLRPREGLRAILVSGLAEAAGLNLEIQLVLNGRDPGLGAGFIRIAAGRAGDADRAEHAAAGLDRAARRR